MRPILMHVQKCCFSYWKISAQLQYDSALSWNNYCQFCICTDNSTKECDGQISVTVQTHIQPQIQGQHVQKSLVICPIFLLMLEHMHHAFVLEVVHSRLTRRKMWSHTSRLVRNYTLETQSHHICGLDISYQRASCFRPHLGLCVSSGLEWQNHCLGNARYCTSITVFITGFRKRC